MSNTPVPFPFTTERLINVTPEYRRAVKEVREGPWPGHVVMHGSNYRHPIRWVGTTLRLGPYELFACQETWEVWRRKAWNECYCLARGTTTGCATAAARKIAMSVLISILTQSKLDEDHMLLFTMPGELVPRVKQGRTKYQENLRTRREYRK